MELPWVIVGVFTAFSLWVLGWVYLPMLGDSTLRNTLVANITT